MNSSVKSCVGSLSRWQNGPWEDSCIGLNPYEMPIIDTEPIAEAFFSTSSYIQ